MRISDSEKIIDAWSIEFRILYHPPLEELWSLEFPHITLTRRCSVIIYRSFAREYEYARGDNAILEACEIESSCVMVLEDSEEMFVIETTIVCKPITESRLFQESYERVNVFSRRSDSLDVYLRLFCYPDIVSTFFMHRLEDTRLG